MTKTEAAISAMRRRLGNSGCTPGSRLHALTLSTPSINSIDELLASDDFNEQAPDLLKQELNDRIDELTDRKGSSSKGREECLTSYVRILHSHYIADGLYGRVPDLIGSFTRSIKAETSEKEAVLALRALALTAITISDDSLYETSEATVKRSVTDSQSFPTKAAAIHCLGTCIAFGAVAEEEILETLAFLLEVVTSDGNLVGAADNAETVTAALRVYGFLATLVEDLENESEEAIEAFLEQLDSSDPEVQIAAGENIALLYEKSYTPQEEDETVSDLEELEEGGDSSGDDSGDSSLIKRYNAYHNTSAVVEKVSALASLSTHKLNKRFKQQLHKSFSSILIAVENPRLGLRTNSARGMRIKIYQAGEMDVDSWWKLMRLNALRRILSSGFVAHYFEGNKRVLEILPIIMRDTRGASGERSGVASPRRGGKDKPSKGKYRESRRFLDVPDL
jgi:Interferon-related developmental regulator (IFRD)